MNALAYALQLLAALPQLIAAGRDITTLLQEGRDKLQEMKDQGRDPTTAEWDELNARIDTLRSELHSGTSMQVRKPGEAPLPGELAYPAQVQRQRQEDGGGDATQQPRPRRQPEQPQTSRQRREAQTQPVVSRAVREEGAGHGLRGVQNTDGDGDKK